MKKASYWQIACDDLSANDPVIGKIILSYHGEFLSSRGQAFETLLRSIVGQQISVKAAQSVWEKLLKTLGSAKPDIVFKVSPLKMRKAGLSERKVEYAKDLARHFLDGSLDQHRWHLMSDEEIIEHLVLVRGIGRWTAEMFLIFHLLRPNVFPADDLGLQKAISIHYNKRYPMSDRQLEIFRKRFSPWATVATWYLWRALDPIPVEY